MVNLDPELWEYYTRRKPVYSVKVFDTMLVGIYDMKAARHTEGGQAREPSGKSPGATLTGGDQ
jgi:hypothetical protein